MHGPTLSLGASSSFRAQRGGALQPSGFRAGAQLGFSAGTRVRHAIEREPQPLAGTEGTDAASACAYDLTCRWEREQRSRALARALGEAELRGEQP